MRLKHLLALFLFALPAFAQTPVTVTGLVTDAGNNPATSGYVQFDIMPKVSSVHYFIAGFGTITQTTQCGINGSGQVLNLALSGPCTIWGNDLITPGNTQYKVTFAPNGNISNIIPGECITGVSYSLNSPVFCPVVQINPQQTIIRANPFATNVIPLVDASFNVGSPSFRYNGYFANIHLDNCTGAGCSNANALLSSTNTWTGSSNTFNNTVNLNGGGTFAGSWLGNPTLLGNWTWGSTQTFNGSLLFNILISTGANPAGSGYIRLPSVGTFNFRNNANSADCSLSKNSSDQLFFTCGGILFDVTTNFLKNSTNTAGHYLRNNGTQYVDNTIQSGDLPATTSNCTGTLNFAVGLSSGGIPSCSNVVIPPTVQSFQQSSLSGDVAVSANTTTTVTTQAVTMPSSGCPCRALISYFTWITTGSSGTGYSLWVSDGSNVMIPTSTGQSNGSSGGATSANASGFSQVTYSNGANVTFTLTTRGTLTYTVKAAPLNGSGPNSSLQVVVFTSN